jgi:hypothetical protein
MRAKYRKIPRRGYTRYLTPAEIARFRSAIDLACRRIDRYQRRPLADDLYIRSGAGRQTPKKRGPGGKPPK